MLTYGLIESYLISRCLHRLRCCGYLIEEKDIHDIGRLVHIEYLRTQPYRELLIGIRRGDTAKVDGVEQEKTDIRHFHPLTRMLGNLRCDLPDRL